MVEVQIEKNLGSFQLNVEFTAGNEVLALLGASGSGKSMTLRLIAGVEKPDRGRIVVDNTVFFDSEQKINLTPQRRKAGLLFQNYALFPTMTVMQNIMTGVRSGSRSEKQRIAREALERFQLADLGNRTPAQISGGQQQRAALARILVGQPRILMLDEPFSALDSHLRDQMEREVLKIIRNFGGTTILVSHSRDEVFRMADRIAVYDAGKIDALEEKHILFQNPKTYRTALLTGCKNFSAVSNLTYENGVTTFFADDWGIVLQMPGQHSGEIVGVRSQMLQLSAEGGPDTYRMEVAEILEDTAEYTVLLKNPERDSAMLQWTVSKTSAPPQGVVFLEIPPSSLMLLSR